MKIEGKVIEIMPEKQITDKFTIRNFVLSVASGNYEHQIIFDLVNDKAKLADTFHVDDNIEVEFDITGRKAKDKYWNSLRAYRVKNLNEKKIEPKEIQQPTETVPEPIDDLPF